MTKHLMHLTHVEDLIIEHGPSGINLASDVLWSVEEYHERLGDRYADADEYFDAFHLSQKFDGAPSIVFGKCPATGQYFVGTKSVFNKVPKINYSPDDIYRNHGHSEGLAEYLIQAFDHLWKICPESGFYQGDIMYTNDVEVDGDFIHFTPNTITYSAHRSHPEYELISDASIGIAIHTQYNCEHPHNGDMRNFVAKPLTDKLPGHSDVHQFDVSVKRADNFNIVVFMRLMDRLKDMRHEFTYVTDDWLKSNREYLTRYINSCVREVKLPEYYDYLWWVNEKLNEKLISYTRQDCKAGVQTEIDKFNKQNNENDFNCIMAMHSRVQAIKGYLLQLMAKNQNFKHSVNGAPVKPEGYVVHAPWGSVKLVDRREFSKLNFDKNG